MKVNTIIDRFASAPSPATMERLIAAFRQPDVADEDVAFLATRLSASGETLSHKTLRPVADVPSTGGPSSLSTLLCPLQLVHRGAIVPKLGVPGRPAGGIDVLACIPGFRVSLDKTEIARCLESCRYAHFLAGERFAPLDNMFFAYRRYVGATDVPPLAIASLLAKKMAVGVGCVTLDVRVAPFTNFGPTWDEARSNARRFIRIAKMLSINATCFLTDASAPYQRFIGRGESLVALHSIFSADPGQDLAAHVELCRNMASACFGGTTAEAASDLKEIFSDHIEQQGASWEHFVRKVNEVKSQPTAVITAESGGYLSVDLAGLRRVLVVCQESKKSANNKFPDSCGITLSVPCGTAVQKGEAIARVRSSLNLETLVVEIQKCILICARHIPTRAAEMVVDHG